MFAAFVLLTSPVWLIGLFLLFCRVTGGGRSLKQQAYDREVKRRKEQIMLGDIDARINQEALRQYRDERD